MKPIHINFIANGGRKWWAFAMACTGVFCAAVCGVELSKAYSEERTLAAELAKANARLANNANARSGVSTLSENEKERIRAANLVIADIDKPWAALLNALESSGTDHTSLLTVEPDGDRRELKLLGEARSTEAVFTFLQTLSAQPAIDSAYLLGHQINAQDPQRPVRFNVQASWKPVGLLPKKPLP